MGYSSVSFVHGIKPKVVEAVDFVGAFGPVFNGIGVNGGFGDNFRFAKGRNIIPIQQLYL